MAFIKVNLEKTTAWVKAICISCGKEEEVDSRVADLPIYCLRCCIAGRIPEEHKGRVGELTPIKPTHKPLKRLRFK